MIETVMDDAEAEGGGVDAGEAVLDLLETAGCSEYQSKLADALSPV